MARLNNPSDVFVGDSNSDAAESLMARPNNPGDVFIGDSNSDAAVTAKQSKRQRRRRKQSTQEKEPAHEVLVLTDADVVELKSATGKSSRRSPRAHTYDVSSRCCKRLECFYSSAF